MEINSIWNDTYAAIALHLVIALAAGGIIGLERSYHGRPAGFRTHALVCLSSCMLMVLTVYQDTWFSALSLDQVSVDPTRMAQGIMTGIGFLGAGVIMKEGLSVRGLTTAASIWITAAIGILVGIGFYFPAGVATILTLGTLSVFRWIEMKMPTQFHAHFSIRFFEGQKMVERDLRQLVTSHGFSVANLNYRSDAIRKFFEYRMMIRTLLPENAARLCDALGEMPSVMEFRISPTGD